MMQNPTHQISSRIKMGLLLGVGLGLLGELLILILLLYFVLFEMESKFTHAKLSRS